MNKDPSEKFYDLDEKTSAALDKLIKERFQGKYKDDNDGFTKAFLQLSEQATYD
jgi:hypothetical protein